jgi:hypothetical protein
MEHVRDIVCLLRCVGPAESRLMHCSLSRLIVLTTLLVLPFISIGAPCQMAWETCISERGNYRREITGQFSRNSATSMSLSGSLTCCKAATWDRWLYFPSEGRNAEDFFAWKIRRLWPGLNPRTWVPEASVLTTRSPKPLDIVCR